MYSFPSNRFVCCLLAIVFLSVCVYSQEDIDEEKSIPHQGHRMSAVHPHHTAVRQSQRLHSLRNDKEEVDDEKLTQNEKEDLAVDNQLSKPQSDDVEQADGESVNGSSSTTTTTSSPQAQDSAIPTSAFEGESEDSMNATGSTLPPSTEPQLISAFPVNTDDFTSATDDPTDTTFLTVCIVAGIIVLALFTILIVFAVRKRNRSYMDQIYRTAQMSSRGASLNVVEDAIILPEHLMQKIHGGAAGVGGGKALAPNKITSASMSNNNNNDNTTNINDATTNETADNHLTVVIP